MGRRSEKQIGALVHMHRRKEPGLGIIIDRISKADDVALPENVNMPSEFRGGTWVWEARNASPASTFVLVQWFKKPSEYSDETFSRIANKAWYPISYLKVISKR